MTKKTMFDIYLKSFLFQSLTTDDAGNYICEVQQESDDDDDVDVDVDVDADDDDDADDDSE